MQLNTTRETKPARKKKKPNLTESIRTHKWLFLIKKQSDSSAQNCTSTISKQNKAVLLIQLESTS